MEGIAPLLREKLVEGGEVFAGWVSGMDAASEVFHPTLRDETAKDEAPELSGLGEESGRASHDAHTSESMYGAPGSGARLSAWVRNEMKTVETEIKYAGYLDQQRRSMEKMRKAEKRAIPGWFDYSAVSGLSSEMKQTLSRVRPQTLGQASRIAGVTPAAVSLIHVYIEIQGRKRVA